MSQRGSREDTGAEKQQLRGNLAPAGRHSDRGLFAGGAPAPARKCSRPPSCRVVTGPPPPACIPSPLSPAPRRRGPCCDCRPLQDRRRRQGGSTVVSEPPPTTGPPAELSSKGVSLVHRSPGSFCRGEAAGFAACLRSWYKPAQTPVNTQRSRLCPVPPSWGPLPPSQPPRP